MFLLKPILLFLSDTYFRNFSPSSLAEKFDSKHTKTFARMVPFAWFLFDVSVKCILT